MVCGLYLGVARTALIAWALRLEPIEEAQRGKLPAQMRGRLGQDDGHARSGQVLGGGHPAQPAPDDEHLAGGNVATGSSRHRAARLRTPGRRSLFTHCSYSGLSCVYPPDRPRALDDGHSEIL